jgi:hypothetical protein
MSEKLLPSQTEQPKDAAHWMKVFADVPKAVLVKVVAESIQQLPQLQQVHSLSHAVLQSA